MADCFDIKQGMIFFVDDITAEESTLFKGENTPRKRRPWVIVSNDRCNMYGHILTGVPIYTRSEITLPTQVYFEYHGRHQVIACENVTALPREMIDMRGYVGTLSTKLFKKVQIALSNQFSTSYGVDDTMNTISNSVENIVKNMDINSIIMEQLCSLLLGKTKNIEISDMINVNSDARNISAIETNTSNSNVNKTVDDINTNIVDKQEKIIKAKKSTTNITNTKKSTTTKSFGKIVHKKHGKFMSIEEAFDFYVDCDKLNIVDLYNKWSEYGVIMDKEAVAKKKYGVKKRLQKEGLL